MSYLNTNIERPLYGNEKKVSSSTLKIGDRFIIDNDDNLWFKLDVTPNVNQYLCSNEKGETKLFDGGTKVIRINGICDSLVSLTRDIVIRYLDKN